MSAATQQRSEGQDVLGLFRKQTAEDLELLAILHDREPDAQLLQQMKHAGFPQVLALNLESESGRQALDLMHKAILDLPEAITTQVLDDLAADYASIYLNHNIHASPEESVWLDEDSLICQDSMFQVRSWFEKHNLEIYNWRIRPDDHLVYQLQFIAHLLSENDDMETLEEAATFMDEHLLRWLGDFGRRVSQRCDTPYFAGAAALTAAYCEELRDLLAEILQQPRPSKEEIEERMQPAAQTEPVPVKFVPGIGPAV
ncbi:TorD/DmsD family molecular chaperone [Thiolapillus sp.]|uniref:Dehydrogenase n=1 Tax=Thiolapillus brandeum TaxID=1076588 RepID=A0A831W942_9GAMM|nr:molecular chaperone TorD family protein [Thiolapillus sp.]HEC07563.1 dehydrogenase [Thiolapillus brandeum]